MAEESSTITAEQGAEQGSEERSKRQVADPISASSGTGVKSETTASEAMAAAMSETGASGEEAAEESKPKIPGWQQKVKDAYPDRNFDEDGAMDMSAEELINSLSDYKDQSETVNAKLVEVLNAHPELSEVIADAMDGVPLRVALSKHFDAADLVPGEGDEDYEAYEKNVKDRKLKQEQSAKFDAEVAANKIESSKAWDSFAAEKGWDEATQDSFLEKVESHLQNIFKGKIDKNFLSAMDRAINYEADVNRAAEKATIETKNQKIEIQKKDVKKGDGIPKVNQGSEIPQKPKGPVSDTAAYLERLKKV